MADHWHKSAGGGQSLCANCVVLAVEARTRAPETGEESTDKRSSDRGSSLLLWLGHFRYKESPSCLQGWAMAGPGLPASHGSLRVG
ncbi:hypothetical protein NDU88_002984 [Pleurodeles waltl]|uniref:Uncharacterized protein n=1 Tax=Pleurodeles waltl TaxID=8319 RepID=A0AAV7UCH5_PLEWA|nr:hypothetical protein NDU88_002984 [Pleurodeles waltl]